MIRFLSPKWIHTHRTLLHQRIPNYSGWWDLILDYSHLKDNHAKEPIPKPEQSTQSVEPNTTNSTESSLKRPEPPTNCCMSGCANCVWDQYEEDLETYREAKVSRGEELVAEDDIDPSVKALRDLEKLLNAKKP